MKKALAIAFIALFTVQLVNSSVITWYFEMNRDYIAEVLCVNKDKPITVCRGHCVLNEWLPNAAEGNNKAALLLEFEQNQFLSNTFAYQMVVHRPAKQTTAPYIHSVYHSLTQEPTLQPPQCA